MNGPNETAKPGIHVLAKPIGSVCDIKCDYCFYFEKRELFPGEQQFRMSDEVLAKYIEQYVESPPTPVVEIVWHGGEPTLLGVDFFRHIRKYLHAMTTLLENDMPVAYMMQAIDAPLIITRNGAGGTSSKEQRP